MLDQSFSADNFRRILDLASRKGIHVEDKLSMRTIRRFNERIKDCNAEIRLRRKAGDHDAVKTLYETKKELREQKENALQSKLEQISQNIANKSFRIELKKVDIPGGKTLYTTPNTPEHFFVLKQIQRNIARLFGVKQANRYAIVEQAISLLGDQFPKFIIRTDIKEFYESIQHEPLLQRIHRDNLLTPFSRSILTGLLKSYKSKSGSDKGIPRGIGVSAYLAELYMRDIDTDIQDLPGVTYYARYVDDILIIFTPSPTERNRQYLHEIKELVEKRHKVLLNSTKTVSIDLRTHGIPHQFDYLGYRIQFGSGAVKTQLTTKKIDKYRNRMKVAFDHYVSLSIINEKAARRILVKRIRFLTGNTRLTNNKKNILVGIFYSNNHLTELFQLNALDGYLEGQIRRKISSSNLRTRLRKYSFRTGYEQKRFSAFTTGELSEIMEIWKKPY
jgi:hypothetical protein